MLCNIFELFNVNAVNVTFVSNFLVTFNHSVNLFIYCTFGERFRRELKRMANQTKRKMGKFCWSKAENKSESHPSDLLELHYINSRMRKSMSLPDNIEGDWFRKKSKTKSKDKFYSDHVFNSNHDFCDNMYHFQSFC